MRNPKRIDRIINKLSIVWQNQSDLRLNQLIESIIKYNQYKGDIFYLEDDDFEIMLNNLLFNILKE